MNRNFSKAQILSLCTVWALGACSSTRRAGFLEGNPFGAYRDLSVMKESHAAGMSRLRVVFAGKVSGYLGPCGCSVNPKGGADRRLNALKKFRADFAAEGFSESQILILDAGNSLFENPRLDPTQKTREVARAELFQKAQRILGVQIQNVGLTDLANGYNFLINDKNFGQYLSTNLRSSGGDIPFKTEWLIPQLKVLVLGVTAAGRGLPDGLVALDPVPLIRARVSQLPADYSVIVLSDLGQMRDRELAETIGVPLLIVGSREPSSLEIPVVAGRSIIVQNQIQGQQWGLLDWLRPARSADGWFSPELGQRFYRRWEDLAREEKAKSKIKNPEEKDYEFDKLSAVAMDLRRYAAGDIKAKNLYSYSLVDMNEKFNAPNELSPVVRSVQSQKASR